MRTLLRLALLTALSVVVATGCSGGNKIAPAKVSGKVKYKGEPLPAGKLTFHSKDKGSFEYALNEDGSFQFSDLPEGELIVTVETEHLSPAKKAPSYGGGKGQALTDERMEAEKRMGRSINTGPPVKYVKIPMQYASTNTTPLKVTLTAGKQTKDFELTD